ncbi:MAG: SPOR domain-containing protein [Paramuribaculum sp.]|nr:SPOR domain-containing protein [Paramuribaculum sp.]
MILYSVMAAGVVSAQQKQAPICIVDEITADSINTVELPEGLWELIDYEGAVQESGRKKAVNPRPFTVQVYGDKSRNEANARAAKVQSRFPQYHVRRHYSSPYFRVYLGAFETSKEAQELVNEVKRAFPAFANEVHWTKTSLGTGGRKR